MSTLIVSATLDDSYPEWYERLPEPKVRYSTAEGGHPSAAFIRAFRFEPRYSAYLFLQDSLEPTVDDVRAPFAEAAGKFRVPVVYWARFPLFFDNPEQEARVAKQYPYIQRPQHGCFGPIFYAEYDVLKRLDKYGRFPATPRDKMDAQGTERAWAYAFTLLGIAPASLHEWSNEFVTSGDALPFRKVFAGRQ